VTPTLLGPLRDLKTEAESVSETLFLKKKHWTMDKVLKQDSSKLIFAQLDKELRALYETRNFTTVSTRGRNWALF
jgi:hypothetical protein